MSIDFFIQQFWNIKASLLETKQKENGTITINNWNKY